VNDASIHERICGDYAGRDRSLVSDCGSIWLESNRNCRTLERRSLSGLVVFGDIVLVGILGGQSPRQQAVKNFLFWTPAILISTIGSAFFTLLLYLFLHFKQG
jgi:hypothetical protein